MAPNRRLELAIPQGEEDRKALEDLIAWAFFPAGNADRFIERGGAENFRLIGPAGQRQGCLLLLWGMGHWFWQGSVPSVGLAAVAVAPEHRGQGLASGLLREALREIHARGVPLASLYPSTQPLYRRAGFEVAGARYEIRVPCSSLGLHESTMGARPVLDDDLDGIRRVWQEVASTRAGAIDRTPYFWERIARPRFETARGYVFGDEDDGVEGYLYLLQKPLEGGGYDLEVTDFVAEMPAAASAMLTFLARHGSMAREVSWNGSAHDPVLMQLPEQSYSLRLAQNWMLRIVDVEAALRLRAYPPEARGTLDFQVDDDTLPHNRGLFRLVVRDGRGQVEKGGSGICALDVRDLAALYTGWMTPWEIRRTGRSHFEDRDALVAAALFGGPTPTLTEMF